MSANPTHPDVKRLEIPGADFRFHFFDIEGVVIPLFTGLLIDGPANRLEAIRDMDTRPDDIILTAYLKSGMQRSRVSHIILYLSPLIVSRHPYNP